MKPLMQVVRGVALVLGSVWLTGAVVAQSLSAHHQQAVSDAVARAEAAVVQLQIIGGAERVENITLADGPSTGVVLTADGYVVTSLYRFDPMPASVVAIASDGRQFAAEVVATDYSRKLVLLKLASADDLPIARPAPVDETRVGQWAVALGRTYRADRPNVAVGIVSAQRRLFGRALQTDAAISAANYGGALIDLDGRVLGILAPMSPASERTIAGVEWYDSGIGFAVPLDAWLPAFERLKTGEDLERGYLGVGLTEGVARETPPGVKSVLPAGPADEAGLEAGDVITAINGQPLATQTDLKFAVTPRYAGDALEVTYRRGDEEQTTELTLTTIATLQEAAEAAAAEEDAENVEEN